MTASTSQPPPLELDPEPGHRVYLTADSRPAIRAVTQEQMRDILRQISEHLCHQLRGMQSSPALGPDRRLPWEILARVGILQLYLPATPSPAGLETPAACDQRGVR